MHRTSPDAARAAAAIAAVAIVTVVYARWLHISNAAIVSTTFLLIVLVVAARSRLGLGRDVGGGDDVLQLLLPPASWRPDHRRSAELGRVVSFSVVSLIGSQLSVDRAGTRRGSAVPA